MKFLHKLHNMTVIFLMTVVFAEGALRAFLTKLIDDIYSRENIHVISMFTCSTNDAMLLMRSLSRKFWLQLNLGLGSSNTALNFESFADHHFRLGVFLDYECQENKQVLIESSDNHLLNSSYKWLIWSENGVSEDSEVEYDYDSRVTWASLKEGRVILYDSYKINSVALVPRGFWDEQKGLVYYDLQLRTNLRGSDIKGGIVVNVIPWDNIEDRLMSKVNRYTDSMARYHYTLYSHLKNWFNFNLVLKVTNSYGYPKGNRTFDGLIGMLQTKEIDVGISALIYKHQRLDVIDYTGPTWLFTCPMVFRHPKNTALPTALFGPFSYDAWLGVAASWVVVTLVIRFILYATASKSLTKTESNWSTTLITVIVIVAMQGSAIPPKSTAWKILLIVVMMKAVIVYNYYAASLISNIIGPSTQTIRTAKNILDSRLKVGYVNISYNRDFFKQNTNPVVLELYHKKIFPASQSSPNVFLFDEAILKMRDEGFAIQSEGVSLYPLIEEKFNEHEKCSLAEVDVFPRFMLYSIIQKSSPYRELFTYGFRLLKERGLMQRAETEWRPPAPRCSGDMHVESVQLEAMSVAYGLFALGLFCSAIILIIECLLLHARSKWKYVKTA